MSLDLKRDTCPAGTAPVEVVITTQIYQFQVNINTFIESNTIININGGITININNAPTQLITIVTGTTTVTSTSTATVTATTTLPPPQQSSTTFLLAPAAAGLRRRQTAGNNFVGLDGSVVQSCADAARFTLSAEFLFTASGQFSTSPGTTSELFVPRLTTGSITTSFSITDRLIWTNTAFSGGQARFCVADGSIYSLFSLESTVPNCVLQTLLVVPTAVCDGASSSLETSVATTASTLPISSGSFSNGASIPSAQTGSDPASATTSSDNTATDVSSAVQTTGTALSSESGSFSATATDSSFASAASSDAATSTFESSSAVSSDAASVTSVVSSEISAVSSFAPSSSIVPTTCTANGQVLDISSNTCVCQQGFDSNIIGGVLNCVSNVVCNA